MELTTLASTSGAAARTRALRREILQEVPSDTTDHVGIFNRLDEVDYERLIKATSHLRINGLSYGSFQSLASSGHSVDQIV